MARLAALLNATVAAVVLGGLLISLCILEPTGADELPESGGTHRFPAWSYQMKVWPFDIIYPSTTNSEIEAGVQAAVDSGANTLIFYIEEEQMYRSFVNEAGFDHMLPKIAYLIELAHASGLRVICYLNALEVMAHNACHNPATPTLARVHPDWLQIDIRGHRVFWTCIQNDWITPDMEDAWASPFTPFHALFRRRITQLAQQGLDAVYMDQAALPGMQDLGDVWASRDAGFAAAFKTAYGLDVPAKVDWTSKPWRKFVYFRHQVIRDYLGNLADTAWNLGVIPFFEHSTLDTSDGTLLGDDPALTMTYDVAFSPEIEPEGDYLSAFRMAKFARDIRQDQPFLFLGWPTDLTQARKEFSITVAESSNYYTTNNGPPFLEGFRFLDTIRSQILDNRAPYQEFALIYSIRNKDFTFQTDEAFNSYTAAFNTLTSRHLPFRIIPLETLTTASLAGISAVALADDAAISGREFDVLKNIPVVLNGRNGTRDEWYGLRPTPLKFPKVTSWPALKPKLGFTLSAPPRACVEYYTDRSKPGHWYLFAFSPATGGSIMLSSTESRAATVYEIGRAPRKLVGKMLNVPIRDFLEVIDLE